MRSRSRFPVAMTIAGSDPGGGAGLQADLKTFAALKVYGFSVITAVIAQNSSQVARVAPLDADLVVAQIDTLIAERMPDALKTGALASAAIVAAVARLVRAAHLPAPVVDPVLVSTSGTRLLDPAGENVLRDELIPLARLLTPNIPEAEALTGITIDTPHAMRAAARALRRAGASAVVIKGGHDFSGTRKRAVSASATDLLFDGRSFIELTAPRIHSLGRLVRRGEVPRNARADLAAVIEKHGNARARTSPLPSNANAGLSSAIERNASAGLSSAIEKNVSAGLSTAIETHGTGCAFSAAIAAWLARGADLETAVRRAKAFVTRAIRHGFILGAGRPLLDHFAGR